MTTTLVLFFVYAAGLGVVLADALRDTPGAIAADVQERPLPGSADIADEGVEIEIEPGTSAEAIVRLLRQRGVLQDGSTFSALLAHTGVAAELRAGRYEFPANLPASEIIRRLRLGLTADVLVAVPEGLRVEEIGQLFAASSSITMDEWQRAVERSWHHGFLSARPSGASLSGYLLPGSYPVNRRTTAEEIVRAMLDRFEEEVNAALTAEAEAAGLGLHQVLTLASIVEREAAISDDQPLVASVFLNRLEAGQPLQADPTIQFAVATEQSVAEYGWWKPELTIDDLEIDSPYNTYLRAGLPPGPIANPGIDAIRAVIQAPQTDYYYFVAAPACDGSHLFATTLEEHNHNVEQFRAASCGQ